MLICMPLILRDFKAEEPVCLGHGFVLGLLARVDRGNAAE